ncbi:MAG: hypothetical protein NT062_05080 [Proteobacteria bacterium]|nr:hypothetical protein [Pseudomonadota bacterium]
MRALLVAVVGAGLLGSATPAHGGRSFYGWLYGTEVLPERAVELQSWIVERDDHGDAHTRETSWWLGPLVGVTDQLELAFPVELRWLVEDGGKPSFAMERYGVEVRYRFASSDPVEAPAFVPLGRVAVKRDVTIRDATVVEADLVGAYTAGRVDVLVDVGFVGRFASDTRNHVEIRPGAGISIEAVEDLRLGVEGYGELSMDSVEQSWYAVGPNLAWTHGRFWLSGAFGIGVTGITAAPRVMWGVLF